MVKVVEGCGCRWTYSKRLLNWSQWSCWGIRGVLDRQVLWLSPPPPWHQNRSGPGQFRARLFTLFFCSSTVDKDKVGKKDDSSTFKVSSFGEEPLLLSPNNPGVTSGEMTCSCSRHQIIKVWTTVTGSTPACRCPALTATLASVFMGSVRSDTA